MTHLWQQAFPTTGNRLFPLKWSIKIAHEVGNMILAVSDALHKLCIAHDNGNLLLSGTVVHVNNNSLKRVAHMSLQSCR